MSLFKNGRSRKNLSLTRVVSAVLVLGILVLIVAEFAKYLYIAQLPKSVSSKIEPSVDKLAVVLGVAKTSLESLDAGNSGDDVVDTEESSGSGVDVKNAKVIAKVGLLADSHNDLDYLKRALDRVAKVNVDQIVYLGDYTDYGELSNLEKSKEVMDGADIPYVSLPGDHDLGETRDESNFTKVFGSSYGTLKLSGAKLMYFDNSKNYTTIEKSAMGWFANEVKDADFLFLSQPLVTGSMLRVMGMIDGIQDAAVFSQNKELLDLVRSSNVRVIISGDLHQFTKYQDPVKKDLWYYSIGAVLKSQSLEKLNLQSPRFAVLIIKEDLSYEVKDVAID